MLSLLCIDKKKYKYQWSLDSHPEGDETGQMTDIDSSSLKLSKVAELFFIIFCILAAVCILSSLHTLSAVF